MPTRLMFACSLIVLFGALCAAAARADGFPRFEMQTLDKTFKVGYGLITVDINNDGKLDIVVADSDRVCWFENGSWKMRVMLQGQAHPDNVALTAADIDHDGKLEIVLGAGWKPGNSKDASTLQWLGRGATLDEPWTSHPIDYDQPLLHRIRFADINNDGKPLLLVGPLQGPGATGAKNWLDVPTVFQAFTIPADPKDPHWPAVTLDNTKHVMHNFYPVDFNNDKKLDLLTASYEGVNLLTRGDDGKWASQHIGEGDQSKPDAARGSSEIKVGHLKNGKMFIATIEPFHGNQVVVYTQSADPSALWTRHMLDDQLKAGHGLWCADLDGDGNDEIVAGFRDPLSKDDPPAINAYRMTDDAATTWEKHLIARGDVAVEDLACADLDGDGRPEIIACGRSTHNVVIFWNKGQ